MKLFWELVTIDISINNGSDGKEFICKYGIILETVETTSHNEIIACTAKISSEDREGIIFKTVVNTRKNEIIDGTAETSNEDGINF